MEIQEIAKGLVWLIFPFVVGVVVYFYKKDIKAQQSSAMAAKKQFESHIQEQRKINEFLKENLLELKIISKYHDNDIKNLKQST